MIDGPRLPAGSGAADSLVVFLHGYGADGNDLIAIGREWARSLPRTAFVAPHAPEPCAEAPVGRQWFPLTLRDPSEYGRGVRAAQSSLDAFLDAELARHGVPSRRMALVGFSQGTMMALHVGPRRREPVAGIVGYSGLLADAQALQAEAAQKPPVLLVHGGQDELIPAAALYASANGLSAAEIPVEFHLSPMLGHGIDPEGLRMGLSFLQRVFAA